MKVTALSLKGTYLEWSRVMYWKLDGGTLTLAFQSGDTEIFRLLPEYIGLYDDAPPFVPPPGARTEVHEGKFARNKPAAAERADRGERARG